MFRPATKTPFRRVETRTEERESHETVKLRLSEAEVL